MPRDCYGMGQHKEEDLARWRGLVSEQATSGKSVAAFCGERGLRDWQLYEWKKRLRQTEATSFVAVEVSVPAVPPTAPRESRYLLEVRHGWWDETNKEALGKQPLISSPF